MTRRRGNRPSSTFPHIRTETGNEAGLLRLLARLGLKVFGAIILGGCGGAGGDAPGTLSKTSASGKPLTSVIQPDPRRHMLLPWVACYDYDASTGSTNSTESARLVGYAVTRDDRRAWLARFKIDNPPDSYLGLCLRLPRLASLLTTLTVMHREDVPGRPGWEVVELHSAHAETFPDGPRAESGVELDEGKALAVVSLAEGLYTHFDVVGNPELTDKLNREKQTERLRNDWRNGPLMVTDEGMRYLYGYSVGKALDSTWWPDFPDEEGASLPDPPPEPPHMVPTRVHQSWLLHVPHSVRRTISSTKWAGLYWGHFKEQPIAALELLPNQFLILGGGEAAQGGEKFPVGSSLELTSFSDRDPQIRAPQKPVTLSVRVVGKRDRFHWAVAKSPPQSQCLLVGRAVGSLRHAKIVSCTEKGLHLTSGLQWVPIPTNSRPGTRMPNGKWGLVVKAMQPPPGLPLALLDGTGTLAAIRPTADEGIPHRLGKDLYVFSPVTEYQLFLNPAPDPTADLAAATSTKSDPGTSASPPGARPEPRGVAPKHPATDTIKRISIHTPKELDLRGPIQWMRPFNNGDLLICKQNQLWRRKPSGETALIDHRPATIHDYIFLDAVHLEGPELMLSWNRTVLGASASRRAKIQSGVGVFDLNRMRFVRQRVLASDKKIPNLPLMPNRTGSVVGLRLPQHCELMGSQDLKRLFRPFLASMLKYHPPTDAFICHPRATESPGGQLSQVVDLESGTLQTLVRLQNRDPAKAETYAREIRLFQSTDPHLGRPGYRQVLLEAPSDGEPVARLFAEDMETERYRVPLNFNPKNIQYVDETFGHQLFYTDGQQFDRLGADALKEHRVLREPDP